jgi:hypothetical protein
MKDMNYKIVNYNLGGMILAHWLFYWLASSKDLPMHKLVENPQQGTHCSKYIIRKMEVIGRHRHV